MIFASKWEPFLLSGCVISLPEERDRCFAQQLGMITKWSGWIMQLSNYNTSLTLTYLVGRVRQILRFVRKCREKVIRQEKGKEHNVHHSRLHLLRDRESESVYSFEFGHMSDATQPIRTSDSGSTWSLLGQNRCEETESTGSRWKEEKREKIPPFFHQNDLAL